MSIYWLLSMTTRPAPLSAVSTTWEESFLEGFDGLPFLFGGVASGPLLFLEVL